MSGPCARCGVKGDARPWTPRSGWSARSPRRASGWACWWRRSGSAFATASTGTTSQVLVFLAASALLAVGAALLASIPEYREWGRIAAGPYAAGCLGAVLLSRRRAGVRARAWLAVAVFAGAALAPLAAEVAWRANTAPGLHAQ